ncbi:DUF881 domain-containing protein [Propioniferax innocua]|uniref:DUF881 domain-containing protein n=1 Tax=Propioniferax innocua TaxID=1753 RepID=UPI00114DA4D5|nr:DUF881 domain-containing protein [Propioniferax innocua]
MVPEREVMVLKRRIGNAEGGGAHRPLSSRGSWGTAAVCVLFGVMIAASMLAARGTDLRPSRNGGMAELVTSQVHHIRELNEEVSELETEVDGLSRQAAPVPEAEPPLELQRVAGPAVRVTLEDAPDSVNPVGVDADLLVVHQQDVQAVVNELWAAGAEAMTIQGQRVVSTTAVKCVGNTVVLHEVPYAPPYVIEAIGDPERLNAGLDESEAIALYKEHAEAYSLGYRQETLTEAEAPPYEGSTQLMHARR